MQARHKHLIARFSQGERRRARWEQQRLIALHAPKRSQQKPSGLVLAARMALWLQAACFLMAVVLLTGCSSIKGVKISDSERQACEAAGCTAWTEKELHELMQKVFRKGYEAGVKSI